MGHRPMLISTSMPCRVAPSVHGEALSHLGVAGYRSLQQLMLPLGPLTLVCGANGCGKSNLYRALGLVAAAARGDLVATLAAEGGLPAVFWAGPERGSQGARLRLGFAGETLSYAIELGYGVEDQTSAFLLDPEIKREWIWAGGPFHPRSLLVQRNGAVVERCGNSQTPLALEVSPHESLFTAVSDPLEAAYFGVMLWAQAVRAAGSAEPAAVLAKIGGQGMRAPGGLAYIDGPTHHAWKYARLGRIRPDGQFDIVWSSDKPVRPMPFPLFRTRADWESWQKDLSASWGGKWVSPREEDAPVP